MESSIEIHKKRFENLVLKLNDLQKQCLDNQNGWVEVDPIITSYNTRIVLGVLESTQFTFFSKSNQDDFENINYNELLSFFRTLYEEEQIDLISKIEEAILKRL